MQRRLLMVISSLFPFMLAFILVQNEPTGETNKANYKEMPSDWFYRQRAYPQGYIDPELRKQSLEQAARLRAQTSLLSSASWIPRGPSNIGGRITTMAISRQNPNIIYIGGAEGGVLKTTNGGVNWTPLFDTQNSLSMGAVAVDPTNDNIVYAGTGEANSSTDSYDGVGMLKSTNGGASWFSLGLEETRHFGKIVIDPVNTNIIYAAAMGTLYTHNTVRGVFKSTNAGATWARVLFVNDTTGVVDITINPTNTNILLAAAWQRRRGPQGRVYVGGVNTGIYRSTDAGATWTLLSNGLPAPAPNVGRPGVVIAPSNPSVAYVAYADDPGNFMGCYKTTNGGDSWTRTIDGSLSSLYSNFGWYFGKVSVSPFNENNVFVCGVSMGKSTNGGASWTTQSTSHADNHAVSFHPTDPNLIFVGNDGGFCRSTNGGTSWFRETDQDLQLAQFYAGYIDYLNPVVSIGGTQDNGTPRTTTGGISNWTSTPVPGDGFYAVIDYTNSNFQYGESQNGGIRRTTNNWSSSSNATSGIGASDRKNWSTPIIIDPLNPQTLYTGTQYLYRTTNRAVSWTAISPDLTNGLIPGFTGYATITTIDVAKTDSNTIIVGTDDANVWVTTNLGLNWINVNAGLPNRWITRVRFDPTNRNIAYVTCSGFRFDVKLPHVFKTTNLGATWQEISGNLPEAPVTVILVDPQFTNRLYVGTDVGCFFTTNTGATWLPMGTGLPNVAVSDMHLHQPTRIARAFTHGRSAWQVSLDSLISTDVAERNTQPTQFELAQNFPNPFNPSTTITYNVSERVEVNLTIFDVTGKAVCTLVNEELPSGKHSVTWNGRNASGDAVSSGTYYYRLVVRGEQQQTRRMLLLK
ncbi:MAG: BNR/Asp-box repeat protein [Bacteroidetes bacterium]|nr:BNR/Asp-box repeat protein [Bacteroidota bacterium]